MANEFIARKGLTVSGNTVLSGSLTVSGSATIASSLTATSISGSFSGSGANIYGVNAATLTNVPTGVVSSSTQVKTLLPTGTVSSSVQINTGSFSGSITSASFAAVSPANTLTGTTLASNVVGSSLTSVGTLGSLSVTGDLTVDTSTLKVDSTNNRVGIGTATPATTLDVRGGIAIGGVTAISASGNYTILYRRDGAAGLYLGGADASNYYDNTSHVFRNTNGSTTYMRIINTGNVGIGTTAPGATLHVQGNVSASSYTGSLFGNATTTTSASYAATSSVAPANTLTGTTLASNVVGSSLTSVGTLTGLTVNGNTRITGSLDVTGAFTAQTKSFKIRHQTQPNKSLVYGVLESHEHGVYTRGKLTNNNTIALPEEWSWLVDEDSITVQLTPIGNHQNLYVKQITDTHIIIGNNSMFSNINCFYIIHATRKDVAPLITVI
jgi:hypothetical protein